MNEIIRQLLERKSVRQFTDREISPENREKILESALQAPTAGNMMLYSILDIRDEKRKQLLAKRCDNQPFIEKAKMVLVFLVDWEKWAKVFDVKTLHAADFLLAAQDAMVAAQNTVVCAESLGIGSCYIGDILEHYQENKELFHLPKYAVPFSMVVFGYPTEGQKSRKKPKRFAREDIVHVDSYHPMNREKALQMLEKQSGKSGEELTAYIKAFQKRKFDSVFREEMIQSARDMLKNWEENISG